MPTRWLWLILITAELIALDIYSKLFRLFFAHGFSAPSDLAHFRMAGTMALHHAASGALYQVRGFLYPPPFYLVAVLLALPSPLWSYILLSAASVLALAAAGRALGLGWRAVALGLVSPVMLLSLMIGQTGGISSALLLLGLGLAPVSPALAGIAAGCLVLKPQLGLLLPACYLGARNWTALRSAALTSALLCAAAWAWFGPEAWRGFIAHGTASSLGTLDLPWGQNFQTIMVTPFMTARSLGAGLGLARWVQGVCTAGALGAAYYLWRPRQSMDVTARLLATLCLVPLATPYAFIYDLPALALVLAFDAQRSGWRAMAPVSLFWLAAALYVILSVKFFVTGPVLLALLLLNAGRNGFRQSQETGLHFGETGATRRI